MKKEELKLSSILQLTKKVIFELKLRRFYNKIFKKQNGDLYFTCFPFNFFFLNYLFLFLCKKIITTTSYAQLGNAVNAEKNKIEGWLEKNLKMLETTKRAVETLPVSTEQELNYFGNLIKESQGEIADIYIGTTDGVMLDGSGWVPPADYDPRKRPWYIDGLN